MKLKAETPFQRRNPLVRAAKIAAFAMALSVASPEHILKDGAPIPLAFTLR